MQIHEANFATSVGANAIYSKLLVGDLISSGHEKSEHGKETCRSWESTQDNKKHQIINVKNSQHRDVSNLETIFFSNNENTNFTEVLLKPLVMKLMKQESTSKMQKIISFENQVDLICKFLNGDDMREVCQNNRFFEFGPIMAEKLDFNRIYGKVEQALSNGKKKV